MLFLRRIQKALASWAKSSSLRYRIARVFVLGLLLNLLFGQLFYLAERDHIEGLTLADSYWWSFVTATTVGYGDYYPHSNVGRYLVAIPLMIVGIGLVGSLVGLVTEAVIDFSTRKRKGIMKITSQNHVIVCNYPSAQRILNVATEIRAVEEFAKADIVLITEAIDSLPVELVDKNIAFVRGNATQEEVLNRANIKGAAGVLILAKDGADIRSDERSFAIATVIEKVISQAGNPITTAVELVSPSNLEMMKCSGVDRIVSTTGIGSSLLVQEFLNAGMQQIFSELASNIGGHRFTLTPGLTGRSLGDYQRVAIERNAPCQVIGIVRMSSRDLVTNRAARLEPGDKLMLLADENTNTAEMASAIN